jgi:uncharacterized protein YyaL (SSP411 family)
MTYRTHLRPLLLLAVLSAACVTEQGPLTNRMEHGTTGYLSRAANHPVRWQPWGPEAFALAARLDRPILLVIGAEGCRACAEMDVAWDDPALASLANALFVPVRVDRDERPDVARRYQAVVRTLAGLEGYPLTVFLTADGAAYFGGTTFPVDDPLTGRGLRQILPEAARGYRERRALVLRQAAAAQQLAAATRPTARGLVGAAAVDAGIAALRAGLGHAPDEGVAPAVARARAAGVLLARFGATEDSALLLDARAALAPLLAAGDSAPAGGDAAGVLHATIVGAAVRGWAATGDSLYWRMVRDALVDLRGHLPGARDAVFTDATAFLLAAALDAGPAVGDDAVAARALAVLDGLVRRVYARDHGARHGTSVAVRGLLQDQVQLAGAALAAWRLTGEQRYLELARDLMALVERDYADPLGGFYDTAAPDAVAPALADRTRQLRDDLLPAPNAAAARVLLELADATGDGDFRRRADAVLEAFAGEASAHGLAAAGYLDAAVAALARRM